MFRFEQKNGSSFFFIDWGQLALQVSEQTRQKRIQNPIEQSFLRNQLTAEGR